MFSLAMRRHHGGLESATATPLDSRVLAPARMTNLGVLILAGTIKGSVRTKVEIIDLSLVTCVRENDLHVPT